MYQFAKFRDNKLQAIKSEFNTKEHEIREAPIVLANALLNNNVIGLINGRMEFGPRALCNRSIIYKTSDKSVNDWLNKRMSRTDFMPFAPVIRKEIAGDCIKDFSLEDVTLNFMTSTIDCKDDFIKSCPAVVHIDGTARPQIVSKESNIFIWKVLKEWEKLSGEMSLINTSFNVHEEPIICDIDEGLKSLKNNVIDQLWVVDENIATCFTS